MKFHMQPQGKVGTKICSNSLGYMAKMTAMPIYGNNLQKSSPEPVRFKLGM